MADAPRTIKTTARGARDLSPESTRVRSSRTTRKSRIRRTPGARRSPYDDGWNAPPEREKPRTQSLGPRRLNGDPCRGRARGGPPDPGGAGDIGEARPAT